MNNNNNITGIEQNELFRTSHLTILICYTVFLCAYRRIIAPGMGRLGACSYSRSFRVLLGDPYTEQISRKGEIMDILYLMMGTFYFTGYTRPAHLILRPS